MRAVDIIRKKRDGQENSREEIALLVDGATHGTVPDYQLAAWLMAVVWRGMTPAESAALTEAMLRSGEVLDFSDIAGGKVDKHSTGGVGDKTSLVIAPVVAAADAGTKPGRAPLQISPVYVPMISVPMISGRGLGHTGGTLDKLESIPGFNVNLSLAEFRGVLEKCGCALIGQTPEIAPADKKLYALRDVTGTVESPYLICASIMSKKMAEGIDALVLDVKTGSGAFMKKRADAEYLAQLMVETGKRMGKKIVALLTDMSQPLGRKVGNALEVIECLEIMNGQGPHDLRDLCDELSAWMFLLGGRVATLDEGRSLAAEMIASGKALQKFREIIRLQGGDPRIVDDPSVLPKAQHIERVTAPRAGYVTAIQCEQVGIASMMLGGGREKMSDKIDPGVGLVLEKKIGDTVQAGETLCTVHYNSDARLAESLDLLAKSFEIGAQAPSPQQLVLKTIGAEEYQKEIPQ
ncbi:MAG TPA: thymidine phosphorylase [Candidatus Acidoferrales bacterium]|jgi:pyrimidine-nucleoside phosphorylase/thymidine phosphorylase|nr:thymidine phosphorylase [Candidatus Acidoferrales bacterium]